MRAGLHVARHDRVVHEFQDAPVRACGRGPHHLVDAVPGDGTPGPQGHVDERAVGQGDAQGGGMDPAGELRQDLFEDGGGVGLGRHDVLRGGARQPQVLGRHVRQPLGAGVGVHHGEVGPVDAAGAVKRRQERRGAMGRAGGVAHDPVLRAEPVVVHAVDDRDVRPLARRHAQDDAAGAGREMALDLRTRAIAPGRLHDVVHPQVGPAHGVGVLPREHRDLPPPGVQVAAPAGDQVREPPEDRVVAEKVDQGLRIGDVRDRADPDVVALVEQPEQVAADAAEPRQP